MKSYKVLLDAVLDCSKKQNSNTAWNKWDTLNQVPSETDARGRTKPVVSTTHIPGKHFCT